MVLQHHVRKGAAHSPSNCYDRKSGKYSISVEMDGSCGLHRSETGMEASFYQIEVHCLNPEGRKGLMLNKTTSQNKPQDDEATLGGMHFAPDESSVWPNMSCEHDDIHQHKVKGVVTQGGPVSRENSITLPSCLTGQKIKGSFQIKEHKHCWSLEAVSLFRNLSEGEDMIDASSRRTEPKLAFTDLSIAVSGQPSKDKARSTFGVTANRLTPRWFSHSVRVPFLKMGIMVNITHSAGTFSLIHKNGGVSSVLELINNPEALLYATSVATTVEIFHVHEENEEKIRHEAHYTVGTFLIDGHVVEVRCVSSAVPGIVWDRRCERGRRGTKRHEELSKSSLT
ncbi:hypothetical protein T265_09036 [Opisthorchis viverrini]|uniref:Uncharacterized protein n=1 Tax=Opisthorchis viverrini TaxID=6198 RepID=A0A074ZI59_OPIVI|nr:hypothetical protein T265_09036 [Opisthorchis viverrini]KER22995.1 hypothetical protein T265_09036 [Opisthorchis viverrini]